MLTVTTPGIVSQTDLHQVLTVDQGEVARIVEQTVVVQGEHLQGLEMTERFVFYVANEVLVKMELAET